MKNYLVILTFLSGVAGVVFSGCGGNQTDDQQKAEMVADSNRYMDSLGTEELLDILADETDSIREALDLERAEEQLESQ